MSLPLRIPRRTDLQCPRDRFILRETRLGDAVVDVCGHCQGTFFDSGELFSAAGIKADPSSWDRQETGGAVKEGKIRCPRCEHVLMHRQDVRYGETRVEIDRCGKCGGFWLDKGELDQLSSIGHALLPVLDAEREKAKAELAASGEVSFRHRADWRPLGLGIIVLVVGVAGAVLYTRYVAIREAAQRQREELLRQQGYTGCPCGCDRSEKMATELREKKDAAPDAIERTLTTISEREAVGYITERMIAHRLRMLALARELGHPTPHGAQTADRCRAAPTARDGLRVCADLVVHGERAELVDGKEKLIPSSFRLWLEIENLTSDQRHLSPPPILAPPFHFPLSRWYPEGSAGEPWDGTLGARQKIRVNAIGYVSEVVQPGTMIHAQFSLGSVAVQLETSALATIHLAARDRFPVDGALLREE